MKRWALIGVAGLVVLWLVMKLRKPTNVAPTVIEDNPSGPGITPTGIKDFIDESGLRVVSATQIQRVLPQYLVPRSM